MLAQGAPHSPRPPLRGLTPAASSQTAPRLVVVLPHSIFSESLGSPWTLTFGPWVPPTEQHCRNPRGLQRQPFLHPNGPLASGRAALSPMSTEARPGFSLDFISLISCSCLRMPSQHSLQPCHSSWRESVLVSVSTDVCHGLSSKGSGTRVLFA